MGYSEKWQHLIQYYFVNEVEKACNKMNLSEFNELKSEMERARKELLNLQKKDSEL